MEPAIPIYLKPATAREISVEYTFQTTHYSSMIHISVHFASPKPSRPLRQRCSAPASASRATAPCCPRSSPYSTSRTLGRYAGDRAVAGCGATQPTGQATRCRRSLGQTAVKSSMFREDVVGSMSSPSADGAPRHLSVDGMPARRSLHVAIVHLRRHAHFTAPPSA